MENKEDGYSRENLHPEMSRDDALRRIKTAGSIAMSPELFEKLYLSPETRVKGDLRKTFGNPTPIGICGFIVALGPLSADLIGWRGAGGNGAASVPAYIFFGGVLMLLAGLLEFFLGNTFSSVVFSAFAAFWLTYATTLLPQLNAYAAYAPPDASSPLEGALTQGFNASFGFSTLSMALLCVVFLICSIRTNICFVIIFIGLITHFSLATGAYWALAENYAANAAYAQRLVVGAGAAGFVVTAMGWWLFVDMLLASVDFPFTLPVGDLSTLIRGASERQRVQARGEL